MEHKVYEAYQGDPNDNGEMGANRSKREQTDTEEQSEPSKYCLF